MSEKAVEVQKMDVQRLDYPQTPEMEQVLALESFSSKPTLLSRVRRRFIKFRIFGIGNFEFQDTLTTVERSGDQCDEQ